MNIEDIVDCDRYKYVQPYDQIIPTYKGDLPLEKGLLSDGSTGVLDRCRPAHMAHDKIYLIPQINGIVLTKRQCDLIYGQILVRKYLIFTAAWRTPGLLLGAGTSAWENYRELDVSQPDHIKSHFVPNPEQWDFPSYDIRRAVFIG